MNSNVDSKFKKGDLVYIKSEWIMPCLKDWNGSFENRPLKIIEVYNNDFGYTYDVQSWESDNIDTRFCVEVNEELLTKEL